MDNLLDVSLETWVPRGFDRTAILLCRLEQFYFSSHHNDMLRSGAATIYLRLLTLHCMEVSFLPGG